MRRPLLVVSILLSACVTSEGSTPVEEPSPQKRPWPGVTLTPPGHAPNPALSPRVSISTEPPTLACSAETACSDAPSGLRWFASTTFPTGAGDEAFAPAEPIATASDGRSILVVVNNSVAWSCAGCAQWKAAVYDIATDRWTALPSFELTPRAHYLRHPVQAAATPRGWIVWAADEDDLLRLEPSAAEFVTVTGSWTTIAAPEPSNDGLFSFSPATRSLWAIGLVDDASTGEAAVQSFELAGDGSWVARARTPLKYGSWPPPELIWLGDRLFVGDSTYDAKTDSWLEIAAKPPYEDTGSAVAVPECNTVAYVARTDGERFAGPAGVYWVPSADVWRPIPNGLAPTHRDGFGVVNGKLVVWSVYAVPAHGPSNFLPIHGVFDFATETWTTPAGLENVRTIGRPITIGCDLYYLSVDADHTFRLFAYRP